MDTLTPPARNNMQVAGFVGVWGTAGGAGPTEQAELQHVSAAATPQRKRASPHNSSYLFNHISTYIIALRAAASHT